MENQANHYNLMQPTFTEYWVYEVILLSPEERMTALQNLLAESRRQPLIIDVLYIRYIIDVIYCNITQKILGPLNKIFKP